MKYTLLQLVQAIGSSIDSDEINSVGDSVESQQLVNIVRTVYFDILSRTNLPEHYSLVNLQASGNSTYPTIMTVPSDVEEVIWLKYNNATTSDTDVQMRRVDFLPLEEFLQKMHNLDESADNISSFTYTTTGTNSTKFLYWTNKHPEYYTTFDDHTLIFDSYDNTVDTTLQSSKTLAYAKLVIPFNETDSFTPNLDEAQFPLLLNEAKALAWAELRQTENAKIERSARQNWTNVQHNKFSTEKQSYFDRLPNYGRK